MVTIFFILLGHYLSDFVLQPNWVATNKSKSLGVLLLHTALYTSALTGFVLINFLLCEEPVIVDVAAWGLLNGVLHFCVDGVTSQITSRAYKAKHMKEFWLAIGADQTIHYACLFYTAQLFGLINLG